VFTRFVRSHIACGALFIALIAIECRADARLGLPTTQCAGDSVRNNAASSLGAQLFSDARLSGDGTVSCATCHDRENALMDGRVVARGIHGASGTRNTPSLWNVCYMTSFFWEGRRQSLEQQASDPLQNPREHGIDTAQLLALVRSDQTYQTAFLAAFGVKADKIDIDHVGRALAAFERTLIAADTPFDRYLYGGDRHALTASAQRGLELFRGRARCGTCHVIGERSALFTDEQFHSLGVGWEAIASDLPQLTTRVAAMSSEALDRAISENTQVAALGRFLVTKNPQDIGKFKTPGLRNVEITAPYMHDGSVRQLSEAIDFELYYRSLESGTPLILTPAEKADLLAFLRALTSPTAGQLGARRL
jgi:cytochrome c peroxidase